MTETISLEGSVNWWKRPLSGGLFSVLVFIVTCGTGWVISNINSDLHFLEILKFIFLIIMVSFTTPATMMGFGFGNVFFIPVTLFFWFFVGVTITHLEKNKKRVIAWWFVLFISLITLNILGINLSR